MDGNNTSSSNNLHMELLESQKNIQTLLPDEQKTFIEIGKEEPETDLNYKLIVVGDSGVGKTSISKRFTQDIFREDS